MRPTSLAPLVCAALFAGCDFSELDLNPLAFGVDDIGDNVVAAGAKEFVTCNQGAECKYLWSEAYIWLDTNARFAVDDRDASTMTAYSPDPDQHKDEVQYRVSQVPQPGGVSTIQIETFCAESCVDLAAEQAYQFNDYLRNHKTALAEGLVEVTDYEKPELPRTPSVEAASDTELPDLSLTSDYPTGNHESRARAALKSAGCLERSKLALLRSDQTGEELYEVECLTGVQTMVFRCVRSGCDVLK